MRSTTPPSPVCVPAAWRHLLVAALLCGCGASDSTIERADGTQVQVLADHTAECDGCVQVEELAVLGDTTGPGYVVHTESVVRDSSGNYWAGQYDDMIKVFDSAGTFSRRFGRMGRGPGEFQIPQPVFTDADGLVHILDGPLARETIVGPDFQVREIREFPGGLRNAAPLPDERSYVANAYRRVTDSRPIYITDGADIARTLGEPVPDDAPSYYGWRVMTTDRSSGHIYSAWPLEYEIDVWSTQGRRITGYQGPRIFEREPIAGGFSADQPPVTRIISMQADEDQFLWILMWEARSDWLDHMREVTLPGGRTTLQPIDRDASKMYTSRIEVVDLATNVIVARIQRPEYFGAFMGDDLLLENRTLSNGVPQLAIWKVTLTP